MAAIRKNMLVRYTGKDELAKGKVFRVLKKDHMFIDVMFPVKYMDGSVHSMRCSVCITDVELIHQD